MTILSLEEHRIYQTFQLSQRFLIQATIFSCSDFDTLRPYAGSCCLLCQENCDPSKTKGGSFKLSYCDALALVG